MRFEVTNTPGQDESAWMSGLPQLWVDAMVYLFAARIRWTKKAEIQIKLLLAKWAAAQRTFNRAIQIHFALRHTAGENLFAGAQARALTAREKAFLISLGLRNLLVALFVMPLLRTLDLTIDTGLGARLLAQDQGYLEAMREVRLATARQLPFLENTDIE